MRLFFQLNIVVLFLFVGASMGFAQKNQEDIEKEANRHFIKGEFIEATPLFSRLLSLDPRNIDYNYKFGTCLLYNSDEKKDAFKYLNYAIHKSNEGELDNEAFFYLGKAFHLTFQFEKAIENYNIYKDKFGKKTIPFEVVNRQIEMCENGKQLMNNAYEIIVLKKQKVPLDGFYRAYNLDNIGGQLIITEEFQTRKDKRMNHTPLIHFPTKSNRIYYSSYGNGEHKDIYYRERLPRGGWSEAQLVLGDVNTSYDEDYPYMDPTGEYLYFSSEGHNSMGGFDVFRSKYNPMTNSFETPINLDIPISSPDNDLFYIVDTLNQYAYFGSQRASEGDKIEVYNVRVHRIPSQMITIKGELIAENNANSTIKILTEDDKEIGVVKTKQNGEYLINVPRAGNYQFVVINDKTKKEYQKTTTIPALDSPQVIKQIITELKEEETITIVNEVFTGDTDEVIAEAIELKSKMNINSDQFDDEDLQNVEDDEGKNEVAKKRAQLLYELGLPNRSELEIRDLIYKHEKDLEERQTTSISLKDNAIAKLNEIGNNLKAAIEKAKYYKDQTLKSTEQKEIERNIQLTQQEIEKAKELLIDYENIKEIFTFLEDDIAENEEIKSQSEQLKQKTENIDIDDKEAFFNLLEENKDFIKEEITKDIVLSAGTDYRKYHSQKLKESSELRKQEKKLNQEIAQAEDIIRQLQEEIASVSRRKREELGFEISKNENLVYNLSSDLNYNKKQQEDLGPVSKKDYIKEITDVPISDNISFNPSELNSLSSTLSSLDKENESLAQKHDVDPYREPILEEEDDISETSSKTDEKPDQDTTSQTQETTSDEHQDSSTEELSVASNQETIRKSIQNLEQLNESHSINNQDYKLNQLELEEKIIEAHAEQNVERKNEILKEISLLQNETINQIKLVQNQNESSKNISQTLEGLNFQYIKTEQQNIEHDEWVVKQEILEESIAKTQNNIKKIEQRIKSASTPEIAQQLNEVKDKYSDLLEELNRQKLEIEKIIAAIQQRKLKDIYYHFSDEAKNLAIDRTVEQEKIATQDYNDIYTTYQDLGVLQMRIKELDNQLETAQQSLAETIKTHIEIGDFTTDKKNALNQRITSVKRLQNQREELFQEAMAYKEDLEDQLSSFNNNEKLIFEHLLSKGVEPKEGAPDDLTQLDDIKEPEEPIEEDLTETPIDKSEEIETHEQDLTELSSQDDTEELIEVKEEKKEEKITYTTYDILIELSANYFEELKQLEKDIKEGKISKEEVLKKQRQFLIEIGDLKMETIRELKEQPNSKALANKIAAIEDLEVQKRYEISILEDEIELEKLEATKIDEVEEETTPDEIIETPDDLFITFSEENQSDLNDLYQSREQIDDEIKNLSSSEQKQLQKEKDRVEQQIIEKELEITEKAYNELVDDYSENNPREESINLISSEIAMLEIERLKKQIANEKDIEKKEILTENLRNKQLEILNASKEEKTNSSYIISNEISEIIDDNNYRNLEVKEIINNQQDLVNEQIKIESQLHNVKQQLNELNTSLSSAKKSERKEITKQIEQLTEIQERLQIRNEDNQSILAQQNQKAQKNKNKGIENDAIQNELTYLEEVELAQSDTYKDLFQEVNKLHEKQFELKVKEEQIEAERSQIKQLTSISNEHGGLSNNEREVLQKHVDRIYKISIEIGDLETEIEAIQKTVKNRLATEIKNREKIENMLAREVTPNKKVPTLPIVKAGLITNPSNTNSYSESNPIPEIDKSSEGLYYRVQIGAFGRPVPENTFKEFQPIAKEPVRQGLIRYVAGLFGSESTATTARDQIRSMGYSDAFIVAYCDGERIPVYRARELQQSGACVSSIPDAKTPVISEREIAEKGMVFDEQLDEYAYNKAPNAAKAEAAETKMGLYFTVQVGVYNRPASEEQLRYVSPLVTKRLPNGQIRYSSGFFNTVSETVDYKNTVVQKGISDAFVTSYYQGKRISIAEAERLLATNGNSILELVTPTQLRGNEIVNKEKPDNFNEPKKAYIDKDKIEYIVISKKSYFNFPVQELKHFNQNGDIFYYDSIAQKIKSIIYSEKPDVTNQLKNHFDVIEVYQNVYPIKDKNAFTKKEALKYSEETYQIISTEIEIQNINSDIMDLIINTPANKRVAIKDNNLMVSFYFLDSTHPNKTINQLVGLLQKFGSKDITMSKGEI